MAGKEWLAEFQRRNPGISVRKPEAPSVTTILFDLLIVDLQQHKLCQEVISASVRKVEP